MSKSTELLQQFVEMANLDKRRTGIAKVIIHVYSGKGSPHGPRAKVSNIYGRYSKDNFSIELADMTVVGEVKIKTKELKQVLKWVELNKKAIKVYWDRGDEMVTDDFYNMLVKI